MLGKTGRPYLSSLDQNRPSLDPVSSSSSSACHRVCVGFEIGVEEDRNRPPYLNMHRQTSLVAMSSLFSHKTGDPSFRLDKPDTTLVVDSPPPPATTTTTTPLGTLAIPNTKQHPLSLVQPEVENKTMAKYVPRRRNRVGTVVTRSVFDAHVETKGSFLSSSCFEESSREHPARLDLLQSCFFCHRSLSMARDIYIYRGDRAFCSTDCRYQQIANDEQKNQCSHISSMSGARPRTNTTVYTS